MYRGTQDADTEIMTSDSVIQAIDGQNWLDGVADAAQPVVRELLGSAGELKDILHGVWLGHPLHPVLTDIPIGAWTVAMAFDAVELIRGDDDLGGAADLAVGIGLAGALGSAITGAADWSETDGRARKIGVVHALLNITATGLYATSLAMRRSGSRRAGIGLSLLGYALSSAAGYLGGHLAFGEQIGVDHLATQDQGSPKNWTAVLADGELPVRTPTKVVAEGVAILLVRMNGTIHALTETCPHLGGPLSEGKLDGEGITCPWHGSRFCLDDGNVMRGPSTYPARLFDVRVRNSQIEVRARANAATTSEE
jgi:nitrite reductase/ring-hydroxylating ferredoxin subunit/uncharacterized membrane protein